METEMSRLLTSQRDFETNKVQNYFRSLAKSKAHLLFGEMTTGMYEVDVLSGLLSTAISNSDDPTDSVRTRDTFAKHPLIPDAWKHLDRLDDYVTSTTPINRQIIKDVNQKNIDISGLEIETDFFAVGIDSLQAIMPRAHLI
ncbi:hypothetical protein ACO1O0_005194 [Amphichorda felina]